ncbi:hypothetical protein QEN19_001925 [Hanseniaspora menglaensis]
MLFSVILFSLLTNSCLMLLSPIYYHKNILLNWYYINIFKKVVSLSKSRHLSFLKWAVPVFYCSIIVSLGALYYMCIANNNFFSNLLLNISIFENAFLIPLILTSNLGLVALCHIKSKQKNHEHIKTYSYDKILYFPNTVCPTCKTNKLARSKHCRICDICVAGEDHHCIWLNCCISILNYKFFDFLLLNNLVGLIYASVRSGFILTEINQKFIKNFNKAENRDEIYKQFTVFRKNILIIFLLSFCFSLILTWFIYTQINLISDGMTSNESDNWFVIHSLIDEKLIYRINDELYILSDDDTGSRSRFESINFYDKSIYNFHNINESNLVKSALEIENIYDCHSFIKNLKQRWNL